MKEPSTSRKKSHDFDILQDTHGGALNTGKWNKKQKQNPTMGATIKMNALKFEYKNKNLRKMGIIEKNAPKSLKEIDLSI